jgi:DNA-directed RNA polymerase sigma subunit (sigma70/sigma32)
MSKAPHTSIHLPQSIRSSSENNSYQSIAESIGTSRETARSILADTLIALRNHPELKAYNPHKKYGAL